MFFKRYLAELINLMVLTGRRTSFWPEQLKFKELKLEEANITQYPGMSCSKFFCMRTAIWSLPHPAGFCGLGLSLDCDWAVFVKTFIAEFIYSLFCVYQNLIDFYLEFV